MSRCGERQVMSSTEPLLKQRPVEMLLVALLSCYVCLDKLEPRVLLRKRCVGIRAVNSAFREVDRKAAGLRKIFSANVSKNRFS